MNGFEYFLVAVFASVIGILIASYIHYWINVFLIRRKRRRTRSK